MNRRLRIHSLIWTLLLNGLLVAAVAWASGSDKPVVVYSIAGGGFALLVWQIVLWWLHFQRGRSLEIEVRIRMPHYFQAFVQGSHFVYWGCYYDRVFDQLPLILIQIVFGYVIEMLLCWSRRRAWQVGFGPLPVIGSINLFLWFQPQFFYFQLLMIAFAFFSKEFIRWRRDGRSVHIFNPSAIALAVVGVTLMATHSISLTTGVSLTASYRLPPNFFEFMFIMGLVVQLLFRTTPVTLGAAFALTALFYGSDWLLGDPLSYAIFHINVFLGLNLLATDPATSPRSVTGKLLFGLSWGLGILCSYLLLRSLGQVAYFDKIISVPIVNLLVPLFERMAIKINAFFEGTWSRRVVQHRLVHIGVYIALFIAILPELKHPREVTYLDKYLLPGAGRLSREMLGLLANQQYYRARYPEASAPWGFISEMRHYPYYHGSVFAGLWQTDLGLLNLTVRNRRVTGQFRDNEGVIEGELTRHGLGVKGTLTELPTTLPSGESGSTRLHIVRHGPALRGTGFASITLSNKPGQSNAYNLTINRPRARQRSRQSDRPGRRGR